MAHVDYYHGFVTGLGGQTDRKRQRATLNAARHVGAAVVLLAAVLFTIGCGSDNKKGPYPTKGELAAAFKRTLPIARGYSSCSDRHHQPKECVSFFRQEATISRQLATRIRALADKLAPGPCRATLEGMANDNEGLARAEATVARAASGGSRVQYFAAGRELGRAAAKPIPDFGRICRP